MLRILLLFCARQPLTVFAVHVVNAIVSLPPITVAQLRFPTAMLRIPIQALTFEQNSILESATLGRANLLQHGSAFYVRHNVGGLSIQSKYLGAISQRLVLQNANRITSPLVGRFDLSVLPTVLLDTVEITSDVSGILFGTDLTGEVVNLLILSSENLFSSIYKWWIGQNAADSNSEFSQTFCQ